MGVFPLEGTSPLKETEKDSKTFTLFNTFFCYDVLGSKSGNSSTSFPHKIPTNSDGGPVDDLNERDDAAA